MYNNLKFVAIIPARGGSKGIPHKNIVDLCGKPLISYTIEAAMGSKYIDRVFVSTDSDGIAEVSAKYGANVIMRPKSLATDEAKSIDVLLHVISIFNEGYDAVVLLQPTSPLRDTNHIDKAIEFFSEVNCQSVVSVSPVETSPLLIRMIDDSGKMHRLLNIDSTIRRQDMPEYYAVNGAIYINNVSELNERSSLNDNAFAYSMPKEDSIDIDDTCDLAIAQYFLESRGELL